MTVASVYDKYYERQPTIVKIIVAAGLGLTGWLVYRNYKKKQEERDATKAAQDAAIELGQLANQGITPSYTDSQYHSFVNVLVQAMNGCGTDEDQVYGVFRQMRNDADIRKLLIAFGVQYYQPCEITSPAQYLYWQFNDQAYGGDLGTWLGYDLSDSEIGQVNAILRQNGVNYQF